MNYRTIIGGAFLTVTIAACSTAVAAPEPSNARAVTPANAPAAAQGPKTPLQTQSDADLKIEAGPGEVALALGQRTTAPIASRGGGRLL